VNGVKTRVQRGIPILTPFTRRSLSQRPPLAEPPPIREAAPSAKQLQLDRLRRHDRLGGLLHEYELAA